MVSNGACLRLRTWLAAAALTGLLGACAAPPAEKLAKHMDLRYGDACSSVAAERDSPKYRKCVADAYETARQRAIAQYNSDYGKTGAGVLLLIR